MTNSPTTPEPSTYAGIAIFGPWGVGKDYFLGRLEAACVEAGIPARVESFGRYFYEVLAAREGCTVEDIIREKPRHRAALQALGLDPSHQNAATDALCARLKKHDGLPGGAPFFLIQGRRAVEVAAMRQCGIYTLGVTAPLEVREARILRRDGQPLSESERLAATEVDPRNLDCDGVYDNTGAMRLEIDKKEGILRIENEEGYSVVVRSQHFCPIDLEGGPSRAHFNAHL